MAVRGTANQYALESHLGRETFCAVATIIHSVSTPPIANALLSVNAPPGPSLNRAPPARME